MIEDDNPTPLGETEYKSLEIEKVLDILSGYSRLGSRFEYYYFTSPTTLKREYQRLCEIYSLLLKGQYTNIFPLSIDLTEFRKSILSPVKQILEVGKLLELSNLILEFFNRHKKEAPLVADKALCLQPLLDLSNMIKKAIDEHGEIRDNASAKLREIRNEKKTMHSRIQSEVKKEKDANTFLSQAQPTIREGRIVIPVDSHYANTYQGLFHGRSGTGQTVYIEPLSLLPLNNKARQLEEEEDEEIRRILVGICDKIRENIEALESNLEIIRDIDYLQARVFYMLDYKCSIPEVGDNTLLKLVNVKHPLLIKKGIGVVPLSLEWSIEKPVIIISGPNAGGKTVVLKTIGLFAALHRSAIPCPSDSGTIIPFFERIMVDMGDKQSIEDSISTFSAHIEYIKHVLEECDRDSLVLLDELGTATDPDEGAAVGASLLLGLRDRGTRTIATTHLNYLKALPIKEDGLISASLSFDEENLTPLYIFRADIPGKSYGFEIAERIGLPKWLMEKARELLDASKRVWIELINKLSEDVDAARQSRLETATELTDAKLAREQAELRLKGIDKEIKQVKNQAKKEAEDLISSGRRLVEEEVAKIKSSSADKEAIKEARERLRVFLPVNKEEVRTKQGKEGFSKGQRVYVPHLRQVGLIEDIDEDGRAELSIGSFRTRVSLDLVEPFEGEGEDSKGKINLDLEGEPEMNLDIRGIYRDEVKSLLYRFIDQGVRFHLPRLIVIHGKGTGALREEVQRLLPQHPNVSKFYTAPLYEGGYGATVVEVKE